MFCSRVACPSGVGDAMAAMTNGTLVSSNHDVGLAREWTSRHRKAHATGTVGTDQQLGLGRRCRDAKDMGIVATIVGDQWQVGLGTGAEL
jgi:hypothetical protein